MPELYIKYRGDTPYQYRYRDESEVMRLFIDGGYRTLEEVLEGAFEEAFEEWMNEKAKHI